MLGIDPDGLDTTFRTFLDLVPMDERGPLLIPLQEACERRDVFSLEHGIVRADGARRTLRTRGRFVSAEDGAPVAARGIHQDISAW